MTELKLAPTQRISRPTRLEKLARLLRDTPVLRSLAKAWSSARPLYHALLDRLHPHGVEWNLHGTDRVLLSPRVSFLEDDSNRAAWKRILSEVRPGDTVVDVGAGIGIYTLAFARRAGHLGRVFAFEADTTSFQLLETNIRLNGLRSRVEVFPLAASSVERDQLTRVDQILHSHPVDVMRIDAAGLEEEVLKGASVLLKDTFRRPRTVLVQLHPLLWKRRKLSTTLESLTDWLSRRGYYLRNLGTEDGFSLEAAEEQGFIIAQGNVQSRAQQRQSEFNAPTETPRPESELF